MLRLRFAALVVMSATLLGAVPTLLSSPRVVVAPMKTSIYVGNVTLTTTPFEEQGDVFTSTYEAKVWPWFFWGETGRITIKLPATDLTRLALGQPVDFTGDAVNDKNKPRTVKGRAQPATAFGGKIKVRIMADGIELIFNGTYELAAPPAAEASPITPPSGT